MDFEFKLSVRSKLELNALKLCKSTSSGFAMYRLLNIEYDKYNMDSESIMNAELLDFVSSPSKNLKELKQILMELNAAIKKF